MLFRQLFDRDLSQYAYLVGCQRSGEALIIDPQRDVERYVRLAADEGLRLVAAAETHIHADFLSGARELANAAGCRVYLSALGGEDWSYRWPRADGADVVWLGHQDVFRIGGIELTAWHTPGHTPEHLSFLVTDRGGGAAEPMGIVTGDFVFVGDVGRPDLLETAAGETGAREPAARDLYRSLTGFLELDDYLQVWPGHGAGSACGKALGAVPESTVGYERRFSAAIAAARRGEGAFVGAILEGQPEPPLYFGRMKRENRDGPAPVGALPRPPRLEDTELVARAGDPETVILDTRVDRRVFMEAHLPGSLYTPLDRTFPTVAGSYVEPGARLVLVIDGERPEAVEKAVRGLIHVGLDTVAGWADAAALERLAAAGHRLVSTPRIDFARAAALAERPDTRYLDVRGGAEFAARHLSGALHAPHTRLRERLAELPEKTRWLVHCASGARAAVAAALLESRGHRVDYVDDLFSRA